MQLTAGVSVVLATSGTDVSRGLVTKPVHLVPALDRPIHSAVLKTGIELTFGRNPRRHAGARVAGPHAHFAARGWGGGVCGERDGAPRSPPRARTAAVRVRV